MGVRHEHEGAGWGNLGSEMLQEMVGEVGQRGGRKLGVPKVGTQDGGHTGGGELNLSVPRPSECCLTRELAGLVA